MNMFGVHRARDILSQITRRVDFWERDLHTGMLREAETEGAARVVRASSKGGRSRKLP